MSHVLDFIITASTSEEPDPETPTGETEFTAVRMEELRMVLNQLGEEFYVLPANRVDQHNGGSRAVQNTIYLGAANYLQPEILRQAILKVPWTSPDDVRVFICDEGWSAYEPLFLGKPYTRDQTMFEDEIEDELLSE